MMRVRDMPLELKAEGDGYRITGYGSVFETVDSYREKVAKGAFVASLAELASKGRKVPMLWQHRSAEPIGVYDVLREDDRGLYLEGDLLKGVQVAEEARIRAQAGAVTGLSIGYLVKDSSYDETSNIRTLKELELLEVSLVTFPANDDARVEGFKFALGKGGRPSVRDFEAFLRREAGMSKSAAATIASRGYTEWLRRDAGGEEAGLDLKSVADALRDLRATVEAP